MMRRSLLGLPIALIAIGLPLLGGCATNRTMAGVHTDGPSIAETAPYKGRAFTVGSVTVEKGYDGQGGPAHHCLPGVDYAKMLKAEMEVAFKNSGLEQGKGPAIPVNIELTQVYLDRNHFFALLPAQLAVNIAFGDIKTLTSLQNEHLYGEENNGPRWTIQQRLIPAMAIKLTRNLKFVQKGKRFAEDGHSLAGAVASYWDPGSWYGPAGPWPDVKTYGIVVPMSHQAMAQATGQTATQLDAICKANMK